MTWLPQLNADQCLAAEALCFTENGRKIIPKSIACKQSEQGH